ncbi:MAG: riboflavin synthase, partial [Candidatus Aenigmatarchaeota archaeon]
GEPMGIPLADDSLEEGDRVNVERSLTPSDRMGGHIVQGHVESTAETTEVTDTGEGWEMEFEKPGSLENYIVEKGFVAVEGISLTVKDVGKKTFSVMVIPETWEITNLDQKSKGERVNIETDVTARYVEKMID